MAYTAAEHEIWRSVWQALVPAHEAYACSEYLSCANRLEFSPDRIPQLNEVSQRVEVPQRFPSGACGRVGSTEKLSRFAGSRNVSLYSVHPASLKIPFYTPEPDVIHELAGHAVTLASPRLAELNREFGRAVKRTKSSEAFDRISRLYWFTIEFGVLCEGYQLKAYGAGLLSSAGSWPL